MRYLCCWGRINFWGVSLQKRSLQLLILLIKRAENEVNTLSKIYLYYWLTAYLQVIPWAPAYHICQYFYVWLNCVIVGACHRSCWHPAVKKVKVLQKQLDSQKKELRLKCRSIARLKKNNKTIRDVMMRLLKENNNLKKRQQNLIDNRE